MQVGKEPVIGQLCRSRAGRDYGRYFIVVGLSGEKDYVLIADGRLRHLDRPKKKKLRHLHMTPIVLDEAAQRLEGRGTLSDGELHNMLVKTGRVMEKEA